MASNAEIEELMNKKIKAPHLQIKDGALFFPDSSRSGELEDDNQYQYDLAKGKWELIHDKGLIVMTQDEKWLIRFEDVK